ncbi:MAG: 2OG-Fe(II) oxygenase [Rhodospirillales bacterium]
MDLIDIAALNAAGLKREPFEYVVVPGFVPARAAEAIERDFPRIDDTGSYVPASLRYGPAFGRLMDALRGPELAAALGEKFAVDLFALPVLLTVRGRTGPRDGRIHYDRAGKVMTALLYLNRGWQERSGWLRLLRARDDLENYAEEVPPEMGTLLAFRCTPNAWHGHKTFVGQRRAIQLNWIDSRVQCAWERSRHWLSAAAKKLRRNGAADHGRAA